MLYLSQKIGCFETVGGVEGSVSPPGSDPSSLGLRRSGNAPYSVAQLAWLFLSPLLWIV